MAVCAGGSALVNPCGGGVRFSELLEQVPEHLDIIIPVIGGNDFYRSRKFCGYEVAWSHAVDELSDLMKSKAPQRYVILGASAKTWQYERFLSKDMMDRYDSHVATLCAGFRRNGIEAKTGATVSYTHLTLPTNREV